MKNKAGYAILIAALLAIFTASAQAKLDCVRIGDIVEMPVIDENTIVLKLNGRGRYKRADLAHACPDLLYRGFVHSTADGEFCNVGPLFILGGGICTVKDIVDISPDEAKALLARARTPHPPAPNPSTGQTDSKP